jgi:Ni,Fe-hydrogenase III large subunit
LKERLTKVFADVKSAVSLMLDSAMVVDRFDETGIVTEKAALELGHGRRSGPRLRIERDAVLIFLQARSSSFRYQCPRIHRGCILQAFVRWLELQRSVEFILEHLNSLPDGDIKADVPANKRRRSSYPLWKAGAVRYATLRSRTGTVISHIIRSLTPLFTTGWVWPWRSGEEKYLIFLSAIKVSIYHTVVTTYKKRTYIC